MFDCLLAFTLLLVADAPPDEPAEVSPVKQTIDGIWKDAAIGNDAEFQAHISQAEIKAMAPLDMRRITRTWPQPWHLRGWPQEVHVNFQNDWLTLRWNGEIASGEKKEAAMQRFVAELEKQGYRPLSQVERKTFKQEFELAETAVHNRKVGDTELLVSFAANSYIGSSDYFSGLRYTWFSRRAYRAPRPTLAEALAALPEWMKAKYLDEQFFTAMADEPIDSLTSGRDFCLKFAQPVTHKRAAKLIGALEKSGFEYQSESSPHPDGSVQKSWYRYSDITHANLLTSSDGKSLRFFCQVPQHKGVPIKTKPPALHPSQRLPREKRPILPFAKLSFADDELQRQALIFHGLAERLAQKDWQVQLYKDDRHSTDPLYSAYSQTSVVRGSSYFIKDRPYLGMKIGLEGKGSNGTDRLNSLNVECIAAPRQGWAAQLRYNLRALGDGKIATHLSATAVLAREPDSLSFDYSGQAISLMQRSVIVSASETPDFQYLFQTHSVAMEWERALQMLCGTPEQLRDEVLADIATFRQRAREQIEQGTTIMFSDMRNVRSDNPPGQIPASTRPPQAQTKQALLAAVEKQLSAQETTLRQNFREIHAAMQQVLPLKELLSELSAPTKK